VTPLLAAAFAALAAAVAFSAQSSSDSSAGSLTGKVVLITGSTDGLGREVARRVAALGAHVLVHGRSQERGTALVQDITRTGTGSARFYSADLGSLAQVRTLAQAVLRDHPRLDVLVNNAGIWLSDGRRQVSADGHELHFAVNYLSGVLLTRMLLPRIRESEPSRIINVASEAQSPIDFSDVMLARPGRASQGYGQSKLAQIMFTFDLARELQGTNVTVVALHPATMMDTTMVRQSRMPAQTSVDEGARAVMNVIAGRDIESGRYFNGLRPSRAHAQAYDETARAKLQELSLALTGLDR
jgi:NAD(P)-dependent dehydrogenase (short-subunit alcohol dehydrogenase family)